MDALVKYVSYLNYTLALAMVGLFTGGIASGSLTLSDSVRINKAQVSQSKEVLSLPVYTNAESSWISFEKLNAHIYKRLPKKYKRRSKVLARTILSESKARGIDPLYVVAMIQTESSFNPEAVGRHQEVGLMQIRPRTAKWIKRKLRLRGKANLYSPIDNVKVGIAYVGYLRNRFENRGAYYTAAYNMGPTNVLRLMAQNTEPKIYPDRVRKRYKNVFKALTKHPWPSTVRVAAHHQ